MFIRSSLRSRKCSPTLPEEGRQAIRDAKKRGVDGIKFINYIPEDVLWAALDEANKLGLHTTMHHSQQSVAWANVLTTSAHGLQSMEHWYGLPEAMFTDRQFQHWPTEFINNDEEERFGESGRLWAQTAAPGSLKWEETMDTLLKRGFILDPTFTAYLTGRDFMRMGARRLAQRVHASRALGLLPAQPLAPRILLVLPGRPRTRWHGAKTTSCGCSS